LHRNHGSEVNLALPTLAIYHTHDTVLNVGVDAGTRPESGDYTKSRRKTEVRPFVLSPSLTNQYSKVAYHTRNAVSSSMTAKPIKAKTTPRLERLKDRIRYKLGRPLTDQEERLIELSAALLEADNSDSNDAQRSASSLSDSSTRS
jgi:hypothetical protein